MHLKAIFGAYNTWIGSIPLNSCHSGTPNVHRKMWKIYFMLGDLIISSNQHKSENWRLLVKNVNTNYVFMGYKLQKLPNNFGNFERMIRMLKNGTNTPNIGVVSGATKNATGHWKSHCWQAITRNYNLILTPGYSQSMCDCMVCNILWDNFGPFMTYKEDLLKLDSSISSPTLMFLDLFLQMNR